MILFISNTGREAALLAAMGEQKSWVCQACTSIAEFKRLVEKVRPKVVVARRRLPDGYSDEILTFLAASQANGAVKCIIILSADDTSNLEARQVKLGADCVLRDPLRHEVLLAHLARYQAGGRESVNVPTRTGASFMLVGVRVHPETYRLEKSGRSLQTAPQVVEFLRLMSRAGGKTVLYQELYSEVFSRRFEGDTASARVLLAKANSAFARLGVNLRSHIKVIAKSGYFLSPASRQKPRQRS